MAFAQNAEEWASVASKVEHPKRDECALHDDLLGEELEKDSSEFYN